MKRRNFLGLIGATSVVGVVPAVAERREPAFAPPTLREEKGEPLTVTEIDDNFENLHRRLLRLEAK